LEQMIVKFLTPQTDQFTRDLVMRFKRDGFAPIGIEGHHVGFVGELSKKRGMIMIFAEISSIVLSLIRPLCRSSEVLYPFYYEA
jgi:hypothetical protein